MPGLSTPEIPPGNLRELLSELRHLHRRAGLPSVRQIARQTNFSHTAVHNLLSRVWTQPPNQRLMFEVAQALLAMRPRGTDEIEVEKTLDNLDNLWMAAIDTPFDRVAVENSSPNERQAWTETFRRTVGTNVATAASNVRPAGAEALNEVLDVLRRTMDTEAARRPGRRVEQLVAQRLPSGIDELLLQTTPRAGKWLERRRALPSDPDSAVDRRVAVARALSRFPHLELRTDQELRYRRVELWNSTTPIETILDAIDPLAEIVFIDEYDDIDDGISIEQLGGRLLVLYVLVREWSDIDFFIAIEEIAMTCDVGMYGLKHVKTPGRVEADVLTLLGERLPDQTIAKRVGVDSERIKTIRSEAPKNFKVNGLQAAITDAARFRIIPTLAAETTWPILTINGARGGA